MSRLRSAIAKALRRLGVTADHETRGFASDTFWVGTWQAATSIVDLLQIALVAHVLGLGDFGQLALVTSLVALVGKFVDVYVGVAATTHGAEELSKDEGRPGAAFRFSYAVDLLTGLAALVILIPLGFVVGPGLIGGDAPLMVAIASMALFFRTADSSSLAILRLSDRYRRVAAYTAGIEAVRAVLVLAAVFVGGTVTAVLASLCAYALLLGSANFLAARRAFRDETGRKLFRRDAPRIDRELRRRMLRTVWGTNLVAYTSLAQQQLPAVALGGMLGTTEVGLYKIGMAGAALVARVADPAFVSILPRLSQLWNAGAHERLRAFIVRATRLSTLLMASVSAAVILLRDPLLEALGGSDALPAGDVLVAGVIAWGINGALFWNGSLLYASGHTRTFARIAVLGALLQTVSLFPLVDSMGATGAALAFLLSFVVMNVLATGVAVRILTGAAQAAAAPPIKPDQSSSATASE